MTQKELTLMLPEEATDKLLSQLQARSETFEMLEESTGSILEAATVITMIAADSFTSGLYKTFSQHRAQHEERVYYSEWEKTLRSRCSERYSKLKDASPDPNKEVINQDEELLMLNGIRRGVRTRARRGMWL